MFYALPNTRSLKTFEIPEPWSQWTNYLIPEEKLPKEKRNLWLEDPDTKYALISGTEGIDSRLRVTKDDDAGGNEAYRIHALIADYDSIVSEEVFEKNIAKCKVAFKPSYSCSSPTPGKHRLVWLFEEPMSVCNLAFARSFYKVAFKRLDLKAWGPGFDIKAWKESQYFSIGTDWKQISKDPLSVGVTRAWAADAISDIQLFSESDRPALPMDALADAVNDQFPGRWAGEFAVGTRGLRFWDLQADNPTAAMVTEQGMLCFTGPRTFMSWEDIFGRKFVDETLGATRGSLLSRAMYQESPEKYYLEIEGTWTAYNSTRFKSALAYYRVSTSKPRNADQSPADRLMHEVATFNRIKCAQHFVYHRHGKIKWKGEHYLNLSKVQVLQPGPEIEGLTEFNEAGPRFFPWFHSFFSNYFAAPAKRPRDIPADVPLADIPLYTYMAWFQRTYLGGLHYNPQPGQAVVLAGVVGTGKTFMVEGPCQYVLGKVVPAHEQLVSGSQWTDELVTGPINFVDDASAGADLHGHKLYEAAIKRLVANRDRDFNAKFGSKGITNWIGRVFIACNTDPESLRVLPNLGQSTADKISMYMVKPGIELPGPDFQHRKMVEELPYFARWLTVWEPPEWVRAPAHAGRFGVRAYHHELLREEAMSSGPSTALLDVLRDLYEDWKADPPSAEAFSVKPTGEKMWVWEGRTSRLLHELAAHNSMFAHRTTSNQLKIMLGILTSRGFGVERGSGQTWVIHFDERLMKPVSEGGDADA